jgi:hypothetical protein
MLDIEAIINRHLADSKMEGKTFHEGHIAIDLHNAIEEIKRLREDITTFSDDFVRVTSEKHTSENDYAWLLGTHGGAALVAEVERLRLDLADIEHAYKFARDKAKLLERQAVVAWLRYEAELRTGTNTATAFRVSEGLSGAADDIERGEHRREEKP